MIARKNNVVRVVEFGAATTNPRFDAFHGDPADGFLRAVRGVLLDALLAFSVEHRLLAGLILRDDPAVRLARKA